MVLQWARAATHGSFTCSLNVGFRPLDRLLCSLTSEATGVLRQTCFVALTNHPTNFFRFQIKEVVMATEKVVPSPDQHVHWLCTLHFGN